MTYVASGGRGGERHIYFVCLISQTWYMTSQLTPERTTSPAPKLEESNERIFLQPWFWMAVLSMIAIVLVTISF